MKKSKAGFTLIELMVVAIIVAILAAVAIPLMTANKRRAYATEAQAGCSSIRTAIRVLQADDAVPAAATYTMPTGIRGIQAGDLNGTYFDEANYSVALVNASNYVITVTANRAPVGSGNVVMSNANNVASFGGSLLQ
jgi:prepilin-type N-terminal cleavage/methylation domain-containing protein